jgi:3-oxoacyl-[acyl-carrier-protein] synthase II
MAARTGPATRTGTVTGIGLFTPVGREPAEVFRALCEGRSGLRRPPEDHPVAGALEVAGIAPDIDPAPLVPAAERRTVDRFVLMALRAADDALADAGLRIGADIDPYRVACVISGTGGLAALAGQVLRRAERGRPAISPLMLPGILPNMGAARVAIRHGIRGVTACVATACAAGAQAVAEALRMLRAGEADAVVCGCAEALLFPAFADGFGNARTLAHGWADPAAASRPFDRSRNGMVLGEGAAVLVVERPEHADARGAAGYADVVGWGATSDAYHPTTPDPSGTAAAECMRRAIVDAGIAPTDVGYLNAHGTGTRLGDVAEVAAIRRAFGPVAPPVSSCKGVTGHLLGASSAFEVAATALALRAGLMPPTHNLEDPDPACELDHVRKAPRAGRLDCAITNSFGFGGHNVSLVLSQPGTRKARDVA